MRKPLCVVAAVVFVTWSGSVLARAQGAPPRTVTPVHVDGWGRPAADPVPGHVAEPAPRRDLSGIWEPADGWRAGVQSDGADANPSDGKHPVPFTPFGEQAWKSHKPGYGTTRVPIQFNNDPFNICDPIGFPRINLFNLRGMQILQSPKQVVIVYQNSQVWRNIWTDGRQFPKEFAEPRWYGYSVGQWEDDATLVVETRGLDERTWIDNAGRPHSDELTVTERFHRLNRDIIELTLTISDPKMYTKPWVALDKFRLGLLPDDFDVREQLCSPSEAAQFNSILAGATPK